VGPLPADPLARVETLLDPGSLRLDPPVPGSGVVSGRGRVEGNGLSFFASDPREGGGALGERGSDIIVSAVHRAVAEGTPMVGIWHSGGARLQDGTSSLDGVGRIFRAISLAAGKVPLVSVVLGAAAGGAAYGPALTDFVVSGPDGRIFVTGPDVVRKVTGERVDAAQLGGPDVHSRTSGVVHLTGATDQAALHQTRALVALLAGPVLGTGEWIAPDARFEAALPDSSRRAYDMHDVLDVLLDAGFETVEPHARWARNIITVFGRLHGMTVGVLASNPIHLAGCLDHAAAEKAAVFVNRCNAYGIPMVVLADVPGYLPGTEQETSGIVARGAKLLHAFSVAEVPRVTVILRKAYGGAFIAMNSKSLGASAVYAWSHAEVGVMYPHSAVEILHRRRIADARPESRPALIDALSVEYEAGAGGLNRAVESGYVDNVIDPADTKRVVVTALRAAGAGCGPMGGPGGRPVPLPE
jgi:acetyl-CoA/propionyl-CoA carboxylase carboxyl transferase subunit